MSFAKVYSAQTQFLSAHIVDVEVDIAKGLHSFSIVGLPDQAVEESKDRVGAAIKNLGFKSPKSKNEKIVVSLAPAGLKKEGAAFDLPITLGYLLASEEMNFDPQGKIFLGELSLDGKLRPVRGVLSITLEALRRGFTEIYLPAENAREAAIVEGIKVFGAKHARDVIEHLEKREGAELLEQPRTKIIFERSDEDHDLSSVRGQESGKRALQIAAAGGHNVALEGPAGTGKTMLAKAFSCLLPPLSFEETLEVTAIHSVAGYLNDRGLISLAPFRSPHHTSSHVALVGGGANLRPGEITLAHRGVLFLDEFPEFDRRVIESLREPLEEGKISISRAKGSETFPARFILVAALNPCPCGNFGTTKECSCPPTSILRYRKKISGPIADRIDLWVSVPLVPHKALLERAGGESALRLREKVGIARRMQRERFREGKIKLNAHMSAKDIDALALGKEEREILNASAEKLKLSPRAYHKTIKVARTIADLEESDEIKTSHIFEAFQYRKRE